LDYCFCSVEYIVSKVKFLCHSSYTFRFLRNLHPIFHHICTNLHVNFVVCLFLTLVIFHLFGSSHSNRWGDIVVLIYISLILVMVSIFFMYFFTIDTAIHAFFWKNVYVCLIFNLFVSFYWVEFLLHFGYHLLSR
jgi:ABC-type uncharacterized transport system permease subunit